MVIRRIIKFLELKSQQTYHDVLENLLISKDKRPVVKTIKLKFKTVQVDLMFDVEKMVENNTLCYCYNSGLPDR